jgi:hypothetical protein
VGLIGENWYRRRTARARRARERARSVAPRRPRFSLELLETRVLLFSGAFGHSLHLIELNQGATPAAALQLVPATLRLQGSLDVVDADTGAGSPGNARAIEFQAPALAQERPQALVDIDRPIEASISASGFPIVDGAFAPPTDTTSGFRIVDDAFAPPTDTVGGPLFITLSGDSPPSAGDLYGSTFASAGTGSFNSSETGIGANGVGAVSYATGQSLAANSAGTRNMSLVPLGRFVEVEGSLGLGQSSADFMIPFVPGTDGFRLLVRPEDNPGPSEEPVVDGVALETQSGATIQQAGPQWGPGMTAPQNMFVSLHDAPVDGHLVVQITTIGALDTATGTSSAASTAANSSVPFILYVQRQQTSDPSSESAVPAQSQTAMGSVEFGFSSLGASSSPGATQSVLTTGDGAPAGPDAAVASSVDTSLPLDADLADGFNIRVLTGPLASRSSGPLGPILADADVDPTPPVDRHERALIQDIQGLEQDDGPLATVSRDDLAGGTPSENSLDQSIAWEDDRDDGDELRISRGQRFTLQDMAHQSGRRAGLSGLLAAFSAVDGSRAATTGDRADTERTMAGSQPVLAGEAISSPERDQRPDYIKAAYGLILGLGLTAGPLFPDLLASGRVRVPKWLRAVRSKPKSRGLFSSSRRRIHAIGQWLCGRLAAHGNRQ